jgi:hypothetical protein
MDASNLMMPWVGAKQNDRRLSWRLVDENSSDRLGVCCVTDTVRYFLVLRDLTRPSSAFHWLLHSHLHDVIHFTLIWEQLRKNWWRNGCTPSP